MTGIGERIKAARKELGISQTELAQRLGLKSKSTICKIERGEDNLTTETIAKYAKALGVSIQYLLGREENKVVDIQNTRNKEFIELFKNTDPVVQESVVNLLKSAQPKS